MKPASTSDILDAVAADVISDGINLLPGIRSRYEKNTFRKILRAHPVPMIIFLLLALMLVTSIAYAIGLSLGYIPGAGLFEQNGGIYILDEPVSVEQNGITITVKQVIADAKHTFVSYQVEGIPPVTSGFPICTEPPSLQLSSGSVLSFSSGGSLAMESEFGELMRFETSFTYPALPPNTKRILFLTPCQMPNIELILKPAPADFITPAAEIEPVFKASGPEFATTPIPTRITQKEVTPTNPLPTSFPATPTHVPNGSGLYLDKVVEMEKSYILIGNFTDAGDLPGPLVISSNSSYDYLPRIEDANGKQIKFIVRTDIQPDINWGGVFYWAYEVPKPVIGPVKIILDHINIHKSDAAQFGFDSGADPQIGQKWQLNIPLQLGDYLYTIDQVEMLQKGYVYRWHSGVEVPEGLDFTVDIMGIPSSTIEGSTGTEHRLKDRILYGQNFLVDGPVPSGSLTVILTQHQIATIPGPWTLLWTPPDS